MVSKNYDTTQEMLEPRILKQTWEKMGIDKEMPSMYDMICWIVDINCFEGVEAIDFDEFIDQCVYFFSNRNSIIGLRRIFRLFDADDSGCLHFAEFEKILAKSGVVIPYEQALYLFKSASGDSPDIDFEEFCQIMRQEYKF